MEENADQTNSTVTNSNISMVPPVAQTPPIQTPPVSNPSNPRWQGRSLPKVIIGIILFLLVAGSAAGFYVFKPTIMNLVSKPTPTPNPTANWKTYTDPAERYTIQYPADQFTNCGKNNFDLRQGKEGSRNCAIGEETSEFLIINSLSGTGDITNSSYPACYTVKKENITVSGQPATKYSNVILNDKNSCNNPVVNGAKYQIHIVLTKNSVLYNFAYYEDQNKIIKDQILSTFKFTDLQTVNTSNWKTYVASDSHPFP